MLLTILFYIFLFAVTIQLCFYILIFRKFLVAKPSPTNLVNPPISILIAAKNEAENLKKNLPTILTQCYPNFEVVIINDASTDNTLEVIKNLQQDHQHLKLVSIAKTDVYNGNKKNALSKGIEAARHEHLLFTDADCKPKSEQWVVEMTGHFSQTSNIVLGYGAHEKIDNSFLNKLIRYETLLTAIQYFSYAKIGIPYMGVGRNLAYKKEMFKQNNGFESHEHIKSGDDDLFVSEIATAKNVDICFNKKGHTISESKKSYKDWFLQKRRHISTATSYKRIHQLLLGLFFSSQFLFWTVAIILLILSFNWPIVTILVLIRLIAQYHTILYSAKKLEEEDIVLFVPLLDILLVFSQFGLFLTNLFSKPKHW